MKFFSIFRFNTFRSLGAVGIQSIVLSLVQALVLTILELVIVILHLKGIEQRSMQLAEDQRSADEVKGKVLTVYQVIVIIVSFWLLCLMIDSMRTRNSVDLLGLTVLSCSCTLYAGVQWYQTSTYYSSEIGLSKAGGLPKSLRMLLPIFFVLALLLTVLELFALYKLNRAYSWALYKTYGADSCTRRQIRSYYVYRMLYKLSVIGFVTFLAQYGMAQGMKEGVSIYTVVFLHGLLPLLIFIVYLVLGLMGVRRESNMHMVLHFMGGMLFIALGLYVLSVAHNEEIYKEFKNSISIASAALVALLTLFTASGVVCIRNFGKGLKAIFAEERKQKNGDCEYTVPTEPSAQINPTSQ